MLVDLTFATNMHQQALTKPHNQLQLSIDVYDRQIDLRDAFVDRQHFNDIATTLIVKTYRLERLRLS